MIKNKILTIVKKMPYASRIISLVGRLKRLTIVQSNRYRKLDKNLIVFESFMSKDYACSPRQLYEVMLQDDRFKDYSFIWSFRQPDKFRFIENKRTKIVKFGSFDYYRSYAKAKFWVVNGWIPINLRKRKGQVMLQTWHGAMLKRLRNDILPNNLHATTDYDESVRLNALDSKRYDYFISTAHFFTQKIISAFGLKELDKESIVIETGYPRNDPLFSYTKKDIRNIRKQLSIPSEKKVILYTPTWRDDQHDGKNFTYKLDIDLDYLKEKLSDHYVVLFRAHYNVVKDMDISRYSEFIYDVSEYERINDLYAVSDLLMTDYSSTFFDFMALDKPILFFMYDYEHYANKVHGLYFKPEELPGLVVKTEEGVANQLANLGDYVKKTEEKYNKFKKQYAYLDDGKATERVLRKVFIK